VGQQSRTDPTRSPPGTETAWAYTHVPRRVRADAAGRIPVGGGGDGAGWIEPFVERMEDRVEQDAPGFRASIVGRHVFGPADLEHADANLHGGAIAGGTAQLHQQLVFRPVPGSGRPETPVAGLFLASASAHPGGGVHGAPGANAARAASRALPRVRHVAFGVLPYRN
jgi:phytoene dehydrogenase-like protein